MKKTKYEIMLNGMSPLEIKNEFIKVDQQLQKLLKRVDRLKEKKTSCVIAANDGV